MGQCVSVICATTDGEIEESLSKCFERGERSFAFETVSTGDELIDQFTPDTDCVLVDTEISNESTQRTCTRIHEKSAACPVIILTDDNGIERVEEIGATDYFPRAESSAAYATLRRRIWQFSGRDSSNSDNTAELERLKRRYDAYIEHGSDIITVLDDQMRIQYQSPAVERILGYEPDSLVGETVTEYIHPADGQTVVDEFSEMTSNPDMTTEVVEFRFKHADGSWVWIESIGNAQSTTAVDGYVITSREITDRKERQARLERERDRFVTLFENLPTPVVYGQIRGNEAIIKQVNSAFEETFGYDKKVVRGSSVEELTVPDRRVDEALEINERIKENRSIQKEVTRETTDGRRNFLLNAVVRDHEDEDPEGYAIYTDITERKRRQQAVEKLHEIGTDLAACSTRAEIYRETIEAADRLLNFDLAAIIRAEDGLLRIVESSDGLSLDETTSFPDDEGVAGKTYQNGDSFLIRDVSEWDEAKPQTDLGSAISIPIADDGVFQVIDREIEAFDETDLELAELLLRHTTSALERIDRERELEAQNDRLSEFASVISHDLRNPLNVAQLRLDLAQEKYDDEDITAATEALDRMGTLIENVLTLARYGEDTDEPESLALDRLARSAWATVETQTASLETESGRTVLGMRSPLQQLFENLFRNAVEHGASKEQPNEVSVTVGNCDGGFYVEDDGVGIPIEKREQLFDPDGSDSTVGGLGLRIVKRIVDDHGWKIAVTESASGGARFEITGIESA